MKKIIHGRLTNVSLLDTVLIQDLKTAHETPMGSSRLPSYVKVVLVVDWALSK